jgi:hypothetical protein
VVALALGAAQAWATRFTMNPDGVSYLDIGDAYWRGDWHNAINAYWSPLYSWILGFFLKVLKPSAYWEYPMAHLVNFLIYVAALACFEFFLATFIADRKGSKRELLKRGQMGLPEPAWWLLGYSLFISSSLLLIGMHVVAPDKCVAAFVYLASGLLLKIRAGTASRWTYVSLGIVLGLAYLGKAVMFPLGFVFLMIAVFAGGFSKHSVGNMAVSTAIFLALSGPFIAALSHEKGRLTFGDSGSWNYSFYVNHVPYWITDATVVKHPMKQLATSPVVYEFGEPVGGTFPPWYDPTYWHDGIKARLTIRDEATPIALAALLYVAVFLVLFLHVTVGVFVLYLTGDSVRECLQRLAGTWVIATPSIAPLALYSLAHVETRFITAQVVILFLAAYSAVAFPASRGQSRLAIFTVVSVMAVSAALVAFNLRGEYRTELGPVYWRGAMALQRAGILPDDTIGLIWDETWQGGAAEGAFVPRLLRAKIVAEVVHSSDFWNADAATQSVVIARLQQTHIRAILTKRAPAHAGWVRLGDTEFYAYFTR